MNKIRYLFYTVLVVFFLGSCAVVSKTVKPKTVEVPKTIIKQEQLVAEIDVDLTKKIRGSAVTENANVKNTKNLACWQAVENGNADIIVSPNYQVEVSGKTVRVNVVGYAGVFKEIRLLTNQDVLDFLNMKIAKNGGIKSLNFTQFYKMYELSFDKSIQDVSSKLSEDEIKVIYRKLFNSNKDSQSNLTGNNYTKPTINSSVGMSGNKVRVHSDKELRTLRKKRGFGAPMNDVVWVTKKGEEITLRKKRGKDLKKVGGVYLGLGVIVAAILAVTWF